MSSNVSSIVALLEQALAALKSNTSNTGGGAAHSPTSGTQESEFPAPVAIQAAATLDLRTLAGGKAKFEVYYSGWTSLDKVELVLAGKTQHTTAKVGTNSLPFVVEIDNQFIADNLDSYITVTGNIYKGDNPFQDYPTKPLALKVIGS